MQFCGMPYIKEITVKNTMKSTISITVSNGTNFRNKVRSRYLITIFIIRIFKINIVNKMTNTPFQNYTNVFLGVFLS